MNKNLKTKLTKCILVCVWELNKLGKYPNKHGVSNILNGVYDSDTFNYLNLNCFGSSIYASSKKIGLRCNYLQKTGYLKYIYSKEEDELFFEITDSGKRLALEIKSKISNISHHKKPNIVSIKNIEK